MEQSAVIIIRYVLLCLEAVRSKFKLNHTMLLAEVGTLMHECILQKRRNESRNRKNNHGGNNSAEPAPQPTDDEHFDG